MVWLVYLYVSILNFGNFIIAEKHASNPPRCRASCIGGSCSIAKFVGGVSCKCSRLFFPICEMTDATSAEFDETAIAHIDGILFNLEESENPKSDAVSAELQGMKALMILNEISGEKYAEYYVRNQLVDSLLLNCFSQSEIENLLNNE